MGQTPSPPLTTILSAATSLVNAVVLANRISEAQSHE